MTALEQIIARRKAEAGEPQAVVEEPWGVARCVTPSGLEIYYQAGPKRLYRVYDPAYPEVGPVEVPSVSTILEVLEKGGLSWWGMKVGVKGLLTLEWAQLLESGLVADPADIDLATENVVELLKQHKLTVNHVKKAAGDRGTSVHSAVEAWFETGVIPDPQFYPEHERGYVAGLVAFLNDARPVGKMSEVMVASREYGYAGRFDITVELDDVEVTTRVYPKRAPKLERVSGHWLLDVKTPKNVYASHHLQLAAYRAALVECGYEPVDHAGVVRVTADGRYELVEGRAFHDQFLSVLAVHHAIKEIG